MERFIPNPPINLQVSDDIDTRIGFFGHAILNISWERPLSMIHYIYNVTVSSLFFEFLENFTVSISPTMEDAATMCGSDTVNITVSLVN